MTRFLYSVFLNTIALVMFCCFFVFYGHYVISMPSSPSLPQAIFVIFPILWPLVLLSSLIHAMLFKNDRVLGNK